MGGFVVSKLIGIVRQAIIARTFGASAQLDAYYAAFKIPDLLLTLIAGGAVATTFIPLFSDHLARGDVQRAWRLASATLNALLIGMIAASAVAAALAPWLVQRFVAPGFDPALQALTADLLRIVLVSSVLFGVSSLVMSVLQAHERFLLPALADFFYDVGIIAGALFLVPRLGVRGLALGVIAGALLHLLIQVPGLARCRVRYALVLRTGDRSLVWLLRLMGPRILILGMFQFIFLFSTSVASRLQEGSISAFSMGWTLMQMPEVVFAMAIATAAFPAMSRIATEGDSARLGALISDALRAILFLTLPSIVALLMLGRFYIQLLFRGGAFDDRATDMVYWATAAFTAGLVGHSLLEVAARVFYAHKNTLTPFWVALGTTGLNVVLILALSEWVGQAGLALANSIAVTLQSCLLLWIGWHSLARFDWRPVWDATWRALIASAAMSGTIALVLVWARSRGAFWTAAGGSAAGGAAYLAVMTLLYGGELRSLGISLLRRRT